MIGQQVLISALTDCVVVAVRSEVTTRFMLSGHVGPPLPCNSIKLVDVAEMNYLAARGEGEVRISQILLYISL